MASKVIKSGLWYTMSSFFVRAIGFITMPIFTRLMSQSDFGLFSNYQSWVSVFTVLVTLQLASTMISAKKDYGNELEQYCFTLIIAEEGMAVLWLLSATMFSEQFASVLAIDQRCATMIFVYLVFYPGISIFQTWERFRYEYKKTVAVSIVLSVGASVLAVVLVVLWEDKLMGRIIGQVVPTVLVGIALTVFFWRKGKRPDWSMLRYALPIALPLVPHSLAGVALGSFDRVMINWWRGPEETALYSLAYSCSIMVSILATSMNQAYSPWLGDKVTAGDQSVVRSKSRPYILTFAFLAVFMMMFGPELIWVLGGDAYASAKHAIPAVALGSVFQFLYTLYVNIELRLKKTVGVAVATVAAAAINIALNAVFIPQYGYTAAAYTTAVGYGCLLVFHYVIVRKLQCSNFYSTRFIAAVAVLLTALALAVNYLYDWQIPRYALIVIFAIAGLALLYRKRNMLKSLLSR